MNILIDSLPETTQIDGRECVINTDFRTGIRIMTAFEDNTLTNHEKQAVMLANLYPVMPENSREAIEQAIWFLNCGEVSDTPNGARVMSFAKDAKLIYAAFRQTHGIDLQITNLHWWQFCALLMDLGNDTAFVNLISLRRRVKTGKATKEERQTANEMGEMFNLQDDDARSIEEMEVERKFLELINKGKNG